MDSHSIPAGSSEVMDMHLIGLHHDKVLPLHLVVRLLVGVG
jgi:hypothetical protein